MCRAACFSIALIVLGQALCAAQPSAPLPEHALARLGTTRLRHSGHASAAAFVDGGKGLLTAGSDGKIHVWDVQTGQLRRSLVPQMKKSSQDIFSPPIIDSQFPFGMLHVQVSAGGAYALCLGYPDGRARFWDIATTKVIREWPIAGNDNRSPALYRTALFPDGKKFAGLYADSEGKLQLQISETETGRVLVKSLKMELQNIGDISVSPDSATVVWPEVNQNGELELRLINVSDGKVRATAKLQSPSNLFDLTFTSNSKTVICSNEEGLHFIDAANGKVLGKLKFDVGVTALHVLPGDKQAVMAPIDGKQLRLVDLETGRTIRGFGRASISAFDGLGRGEMKMAASSDGKLLAVAGIDAAVRLYELPTGKELHAHGDHTAAVLIVRFDREGKTLLTAGGDGRIHTWDAKSLGRRATVELDVAANGEAVSISPDQRMLAIGKPDALEIRSLDGNKLLHSVAAGPNDSFDQVAFTPDGGKLLVVQYSENPFMRVLDVATRKELRTIAMDLGGSFSSGPIGGMVTPCGRWIVLPSGENDAALLDLQTGKPWQKILIPDELMPYAACFSPDGRTIALQCGDDRIALYETGTGQERRFLGSKNAPPEENNFTLDLFANLQPDQWDHGPSIAFSPDARLLAVARMDGSVGIWDIAAGKRIALLKGHGGMVRCLAFSSDGARLATGSVDTTTIVWDIAKAAGIRTVPAPLTAAQIAGEWQELLSASPARALVAIEKLAQPATVAFLERELIKPPPPIDNTKVAAWIHDLDSPRFAAREKATAELARLGDRVVPHLQRAHAESPTAEAAKRLRDLLDRAGPYNLRGEKLRHWRALEVIEQIRTPQARELLRKLSAGPPEALLTREAALALPRLTPLP